MGRQIKKGLDYFPHNCEFDDELNYIISKYKSEGYHVYFSLLEKIYFTEGYFMNASEKNIILLSGKINVDINSINVIINECLCEHLFNKTLHKKYKILTSRGIQARYFEAIKRRKEVEIINDYIIVDYVNILSDNVNINSIDVNISTQSKVKQSKVNNKCVDFVNYCNETIKRNGKVRNWKTSKKLMVSFNARLNEGYTSNNFANAIQSAMSDQFHKDNQYKYLTPDFFCRQDKLEKYANL